MIIMPNSLEKLLSLNLDHTEIKSLLNDHIIILYNCVASNLQTVFSSDKL